MLQPVQDGRRQPPRHDGAGHEGAQNVMKPDQFRHRGGAQQGGAGDHHHHVADLAVRGDAVHQPGQQGTREQLRRGQIGEAEDGDLRHPGESAAAPRRQGQHGGDENPQQRVVDRRIAQRQPPDPLPDQPHLAQDGAQHRQGRHADADAEARGEQQRVGLRPGHLREGARDPPAERPADHGRHHHAGQADPGEGAPAPAELLQIEVQPGQEGEEDHGQKRQPGERRQRPLGEQRLPDLRRDSPEERWAERDSEQDLDDHHRGHMLQPGQPPQQERAGDQHDGLDEEEQGRGQREGHRFIPCWRAGRGWRAVPRFPGPFRSW